MNCYRIYPVEQNEKAGSALAKSFLPLMKMINPNCLAKANLFKFSCPLAKARGNSGAIQGQSYLIEHGSENRSFNTAS